MAVSGLDLSPRMKLISSALELVLECCDPCGVLLRLCLSLERPNCCGLLRAWSLISVGWLCGWRLLSAVSGVQRMRLLAEDTWASILVLRATSAWALLKRVDLTVTGLPLVPAGEASVVRRSFPEGGIRLCFGGLMCLACRVSLL